MVQSFRKKIQARGINPKDVISYAWDWGPYQASREFGCSPVTMDRFLSKETGDSQFTIKACRNSMGNKPIASAIVDELLQRYSKANAERERLMARNEFLETQRELYQKQDAHDGMEFLKLLKVSSERLPCTNQNYNSD